LIESVGLAPLNNLESGVLLFLDPGLYTAHLSGGLSSGVGIVEVIEIDKSYDPLTAISTRGSVLTNDDVMIAGFVIEGTAPQTVVVRARGPSLTAAGVAGALSNPILQLVRSSDQMVIATNDDWGTAPNAAEISSSGFAPSHALESAILVTLPPGAYTAIVNGSGGSTGIGIVEVYAQ
jgi:hypothetical protein